MKKPEISQEAYIAEGAIIRGDVSVAKDCSVWFHATIRAEDAPIKLGYGVNIQDNAVVHVDICHPVTIGELVTVGHGAIIHGCSIANYSLIGMGATVLNGASVGKGCIIGAGALVPQNMIVPDYSLVVGVPGKIIRCTTTEEAEENRAIARKYIKEGKEYALESLLSD